MMAEEKLVDEDLAKPLPKDAQVWRVGKMGLLISSDREEIAARLAANNPHLIFFFAEFDTRELTHDENTLIKVYEAMRNAGIDKVSATAAMHNMQNEGLYFREAVHEE
jgi:hypothetical protein